MMRLEFWQSRSRNWNPDLANLCCRIVRQGGSAMNVVSHQSVIKQVISDTIDQVFYPSLQSEIINQPVIFISVKDHQSER